MTVNESESYTLQAIPQPETYASVQSTPLSDETLRERLKLVLLGMRQQGLDALIIYADKEHGGNFEYLSGFIARFEEALLIVTKNGATTYVMGNENLKLVPHARLPGAVLHAPASHCPINQCRPISISPRCLRDRAFSFASESALLAGNT